MMKYVSSRGPLSEINLSIPAAAVFFFPDAPYGLLATRWRLCDSAVLRSAFVV